MCLTLVMVVCRVHMLDLWLLPALSQEAGAGYEGTLGLWLHSLPSPRPVTYQQPRSCSERSETEIGCSRDPRGAAAAWCGACAKKKKEKKERVTDFCACIDPGCADKRRQSDARARGRGEGGKEASEGRLQRASPSWQQMQKASHCDDHKQNKTKKKQMTRKKCPKGKAIVDLNSLRT
ncbi:hypothetical protein B0T17DRAFT_196523 [Bombardia bombarda]|uniref:Secreted protein n=1 Tax=Bombardia bombarda TaxID=252184 RepID=A0AA39X9E1_9PEZI|nr:hypothetical protein B0T17DRAFT_196523 [Bombardia bombarda]